MVNIQSSTRTTNITIDTTRTTNIATTTTILKTTSSTTTIMEQSHSLRTPAWEGVQPLFHSPMIPKMLLMSTIAFSLIVLPKKDVVDADLVQDEDETANENDYIEDKPNYKK